MVVVQPPDVEPVMSRLRDQTRPQHEAAEAVLAHLMESPSLREYRSVLERWYGFYAVLEPRLDAWHRRTGLLDREPRRRLPLRPTDLDALGCGRAALPGLPRCPDVPPIRTTADGLGALYVVEGSTLGGRVLAPGCSRPDCHRGSATSWAREGETSGGCGASAVWSPPPGSSSTLAMRTS